MSRRDRRRLLVIWAATLGVMLLLVAALPALELLPARLVDLPSGAGPADGVLDLTWLFALVLALFAAGFIWLTPSSLWRRILLSLMALAVIGAAIAWFIWFAGELDLLDYPYAVPPIREATPTEAPRALPATPEVYPEMELPPFVPPPRWVGGLSAVIVGMVLLAALLPFVWRAAFRPHESPPSPLAQLEVPAQKALDALWEGGSVREVILRCYQQMARVLDQSQGIRRSEGMTPREFAGRLVALGLPDEPVRTLTALFEEARYGHDISGADAEQRAIASLTAIAAVCRGDV